MKRLLAILLCGILLFGAIPISVSAKTMDTELEEAIKVVKSRVDIPSSYSSFDYYFNTPSSYYDSYIMLRWVNPKDNSYIQVSCDKDNHILSFYTYDFSEKTGTKQQYLKGELKTTADDFVKKLAPDIFSKLKYLNTNVSYDGSYQYDYQRIENGILFPDNYVSVTVNSSTGTVRQMYVCWLYQAKVPAAKTTLTLEDAVKKAKSNLKMNLSYKTDYAHYYSNNASQKAFLVYEPDKYYVAVDANSGKVYNTNTNSDINYSSRNEMYDKGTGDSGAKENEKLTEQEIKEIESLKNIISKEDAQKLIKQNKYLLVDKNINQTKSFLNKSTDSAGKVTYVWDIEMMDTRKINKKDVDTYRAYAYARINAKTGKILYYHSSVKDNYNEKEGKWNSVNVKFKKEACKKILEDFLKKEMPGRFKNSKLSEQNNGYIAYYNKDKKPVYGGYDFSYTRVNENVEFKNNNVYGSVDGVTGKIYNVNSYWNDSITFESPKGAMTSSKAIDYYLKIEDGFHLVYEVNQLKPNNTDVKASNYEIRLVYRTDINPSYISPFSGEQLNYDGTVYKKTKPYVYLDIDNSQQYRAVLLLADMNVGFEGDYFYPNKEILKSELKTLMDRLGYGYYMDSNSYASQSPITREEIAYYFIQCLSLEKVASLQGIYSTGYSDQGSIDNKYIGAVALAKALGIVEGDSSNNFNPKRNVTRLEAANMLVNYMKARNQGIYM